MLRLVWSGKTFWKREAKSLLEGHVGSTRERHGRGRRERMLRLRFTPWRQRCKRKPELDVAGQSLSFPCREERTTATDRIPAGSTPGRERE